MVDQRGSPFGRESTRRESPRRRGARLDKLSTASLRQVIVRLRQAIENGRSHSHDRAVTLWLLARAQRILFERSGEVHALALAVEAAREAARLISGNDAERPVVLSNLTGALEAYFQYHGDPEAIAEAGTVACDALAGTSAGDAYRPWLLSNLAGVLATRAEAEDLAREAVAQAPVRGGERAWLLADLASIVQARTDELVEQVRQIKGFGDFLRPPLLESLLDAATGGPVVIVNVSQWRCDALIVTRDGVDVAKLPDLTADEVARRTNVFLDALQGGAPSSQELSFTAALEARARSLAEREDVLRSTVEWLWDVIADPVLTALGATRAVSPDMRARLWWCPTGLLTLLPLHGAGYHQDQDGRTTLDRVVSSYAPTLRALAEARKPRPAAPVNAGRLLFVGAPEVPDQLQMTEDVAREQAFLEQHFPGGLTLLSGGDATVAAVQAQMPRHRWVHLSCHGYQHLRDPSAAGLELSDGTMSITRLSAAQYSGELAFLSACRTAAGGVDLPDEVIALAAALNYTGYRHVVATLWSVAPCVAADVTAAVYTGMITGSVFEPARSAIALHRAVRALRDGRRPLDEWLPFTHTGP